MKLKNLLLFVLIFLFIASCGKKEEVITIGRILPLTGGAADYGQSEKRGTDLALEEINSPEKLQGYQLNIIYEDSQSDVKNGISAMNKLITINRVPVVIGETVSGITLALAPIANETRTLLLSPLSSQAEITDAGPYVFRVMPSDAFQAKLLTEWVFNEGNNEVAVLYINNSWGKGVYKGFVAEFEKLGGRIIVTEECKVGDTEFRTQLLKIRNSKVKTLVCLTMPIEGGRILKQIKEMNLKLSIFGGDAWSVGSLIETAGNAANGVKYTFPATYEGPEFQAFSTEFKNKYGFDPDVNAAGAYDAIKIIALCINKVLDNKLELTGENLRKEISQIQDYQGATGITTFDKNGDSIGKTFDRMIIKDGQRLVYNE